MNTAMIRDRARELGQNLSDAEIDSILAMTNGDEAAVMSYLRGGSTGTGSAADQMLQSTLALWQKTADEYTKRYKEFDAKNPFAFDEVLAKETAAVKQRLDPYYVQTLSDYLTGVNTKKERSLEDQRTLLTNLQADTDVYQGNEKLALANTLEKTREGYADAGLYFSGARQRAEGMDIGGSQKGLAEYLRNQDVRKENINTTAQRNLDDLNLEQKQQQRDLGYFDASGNYVAGATPAYQIKSQAQQAATQDQSLWQYQKQQYLGAPPGVDANIFAQENTNLLGKTLGG